MTNKRKQGFPEDCSWSVKKWERCVKKLKKKSPDVNPYALCNAKCLEE